MSHTDKNKQPSGVVLPPMVEFDDMVNRLFELDEDARKYCCRHWLLTLWKATLDRVCQLNTSPASAGGVDERAAFERKFSDRELTRLSSSGDYFHKATNKLWEGWQARAALTAPAPNHSEQVLVPRVATPEMKAAIWAELDRQGFDSDLVETQSLYYAGIAATPSAGSQGGAE